MSTSRSGAGPFWRLGVAALLATLASVAPSLAGLRPAFAYCREITQVTPPSFDPSTSVQGCWAGDGSPVKEVFWRNRCVSYSLQRDGTDQLPFAIVKDIARQAFAAWSQPGCASGGAPTISATELEPPGQDGVDCNEVQYNPYGPNANIIIFRDHGWPDDGDAVNTLGFTTVTYARDTGEIVDADMEINSSPFRTLVISPPDPPGTYDLLSIMTHEAGHFLGLAHSADNSAIMYAYYTPGSVDLQPDDVDGICTIDPPDGTRSTTAGLVPAGGCCNVPVLGLGSSCAPDAADGAVAPPAPGFPETVAVPPCRSVSDASGGSPGSRGCDVSDVTGEPPGSGAAGAWVLVCLVAALRAIRGALPRRWPSRRATAAGVAAAVFLSASASARADVSIAVALDDLVRGSSAVAVVTPLEQFASWERGRIYTHTRVRVDRLVAGTVPAEVWVRTRGGVAGDFGQIVEGEASFVVGQSSVVFLRPSKAAPAFVVSERAQGQYAILTGGDGKARLAQRPTGLVLGAPLAPPGGPLRASVLAREALHGRVVDDALGDVAAAWARLH
jgi:Matrixin